MENIPAAAKKQWQTPDFYLLDGDDDINTKNKASHHEKSIVITHNYSPGNGFGAIGGNKGYYVKNYIS